MTDVTEPESKECTLCGEEAGRRFEATVLGRYGAAFYHCPNCRLLHTGNPTWLDEAYEEPINRYDTGVLSRNISLAEMTAALLYCFFRADERKYLDYAGGYGIFTRLMRDMGFDFYWADPHAQNLFARGFEYETEHGDIAAVTSFESIEHFRYPTKELDRIFTFSKNLIFSTELLPEPVPPPGSWWYYGFVHGQHISFYSRATLRFIAARYGVNFLTNGTNFHLFTPEKIREKLFQVVLKYHKFICRRIVRKKMKSKTSSDSSSLQEAGGSRDEGFSRRDR